VLIKELGDARKIPEQCFLSIYNELPHPIASGVKGLEATISLKSQ
jgi:hypothetical protein